MPIADKYGDGWQAGCKKWRRVLQLHCRQQTFYCCRQIFVILQKIEWNSFVQIFSTLLVTADNRIIIFPNNLLSKRIIEKSGKIKLENIQTQDAAHTT